jgi:hypothetical protein
MHFNSLAPQNVEYMCNKHNSQTLHSYTFKFKMQQFLEEVAKCTLDDLYNMH